MVFLRYDQAALDRQYDQRAWAPNATEIIGRYSANSERVRRTLGEPKVFSYGSRAAETLDLFQSRTPDAPIQVFIHGGAWKLLSKRESCFAAETFVGAGAHFVALDFDLLPSVTLPEMVDQVRRGVGWLFRNARRFGGDPNRIHVSGHSSGAHLAACVTTTDWSAYGLPRDVVKSAVCASGIYDLLPVRLSSRNEYVKVDAATETVLSPIRQLHNLHTPISIGYGGLDSDEFKRQNRTFAAAIGDLLAETVVEYRDLNHFEVAETFACGSEGLGAAALRLMGLSKGFGSEHHYSSGEEMTRRSATAASSAG